MTMPKRNHLILLNMPRVAGLLLMIVLVNACLIPQPEIISPDLPPLANRPISISKAIPTILGIVRSGSTCAQTEFSITVEDPDSGDPARSLWFVDPGADLSGSSLIVPGDPPLVSAGLRTVQAPKSVLNALAMKNQQEKHRLTVFVTDSEFVGTSIEVGKKPRRVGTDILEDGTRDSYNWTIEVEPCPPNP
jgi:hypothetical protein